jgi:hypothetical protein
MNPYHSNPRSCPLLYLTTILLLLTQITTYDKKLMLLDTNIS